MQATNQTINDDQLTIGDRIHVVHRHQNGTVTQTTGIIHAQDQNGNYQDNAGNTLIHVDVPHTTTLIHRSGRALIPTYLIDTVLARLDHLERKIGHTDTAPTKAAASIAALRQIIKDHHRNTTKDTGQTPPNTPKGKHAKNTPPDQPGHTTRDTRHGHQPETPEDINWRTWVNLGRNKPGEKQEKTSEKPHYQKLHTTRSDLQEYTFTIHLPGEIDTEVYNSLMGEN